MTHQLHSPSDQDFLDRMAVIPEEINLSEVLREYNERRDKRHVYTLENKDLRVEVYLKN